MNQEVVSLSSHVISPSEVSKDFKKNTMVANSLKEYKLSSKTEE